MTNLPLSPLAADSVVGHNRLTGRAISALHDIQSHEIYGKVTKILGLLVEVAGLPQDVAVGTQMLLVADKASVQVPCEIVGFRAAQALLLPFGPLEGIGLGCRAYIIDDGGVVYPSLEWQGRVINALAKPLDGKGNLPRGDKAMRLKASAPPAHERQRVGRQLDLGVRCVNTFTPLVRGQRIGIFAGSGVGKSVLLSMMARYTEAEVIVIGLVGERGREVQEFLEDDLGEDGLKRSVVIVATGDEPALMRRQAAYLTLTVAEYFRAQGKQVLCLMDSVTRFAMAHREIGLSAGEPPTTKGYPPTTFGELARLLERAGPGRRHEGAMTALFTVLVEGDDHNEPVADAVRGIIDGHIVMEREIADRGRFPAMNVLKSVSRALPAAFTEEQNAILKRAKQIISTYENMAELIRLGAYRRGSDALVDESLVLYPQIEDFLTQGKNNPSSIDEGFSILADIIGMSYGEAETAD